MHAPPRTVLLLVLAACTPGPAGSKDTPKIQPLLAGVPVDAASQVPAGAALAPVAAGIVREPAWRRYVALFDKAPSDPCPTASAGWTGERLFRRGEVATLLG